MNVRFKDTRFMMSVGCYCEQIELKTMSDDEIAKVAKATGENVEISLKTALLKYRDDLNECNELRSIVETIIEEENK